MSVVTPDWILDCIDLGKRVEESDYRPSSSSNGGPCQTSTKTLSVTTSILQTVTTDQIENGDNEPATHVTESTPHTSNEVEGAATLSTNSTLLPSNGAKEELPSPSSPSTHTSPHLKEKENTETSQKSLEAGCGDSPTLLRGVAICLCDYQECMEPDTVDKWKQVCV